jgi:prefoldin subunit 5
MNDLNDLYRQKGELITQLELLQARLNQVNQAIAEEMNKSQPAPANSAKPEGGTPNA